MSPGKLVDEKDVGCQDKSGPGKIHEVILVIIDTDEIPGFFLLLKNHIFMARSEDTIFIFHV